MKSTVLITGGSGFLGRRLALALREDYRVFLAGRNQHQNTVAAKFSGCSALGVDVARYDSIRDAVVETKPDIIVHAAATKYVDLGERQPLECIDINVTGSLNVARIAIEREIPLVVGISTDKATPPIRNTYGMTKAVMERVFCGLDGTSKTKFVCTRFGNIAWSVGSVFPTWMRMQEDSGGVIGTTGPEMRRFFFTVDEAVRVVQHAIGHADELHGCILGRRMKAALIRDILEQWVAHRGGSWQHIEGRPGERDDEYLIGDLELPYTRETVYEGIPHYAISFNQIQANPPSQALTSANAERLTAPEIVDMITRCAVIERC